MSRFQKIAAYSLVIIFCLLILVDSSFAQCPMCKAAAESNLKDGGKHALGLNTGILYLFIMPYLLVGTIGFIWWWNNRKASREEQFTAS